MDGGSDAATMVDAGGGTDAGPDDAGPGDAGPDDAGPGDAGPGDAGPETTTFRVRVENTGTAYDFAGSGMFNTPVGGSGPGPIGPGGAYEFSFPAAPGMKLSVATMFVPSNDLFFAPDGAGIDLFDTDGNPIATGTAVDVTDQLDVWDAGTEVDQPLGEGADQVQRQGDPNTGAVDTNTNVRLVTSTEVTNLPDVNAVIQLTLTSALADGVHTFTARIENVSTTNTLTTTGDSQAVPMSPGVWVVHTADNPLFEVGMADRGEGLEGIAEDGMAATLRDALAARTGATLVASPGVWAVTDSGTDLFEVGMADRGQGLEAIAEDGNPAPLAAAVGSSLPGAGVFNTPMGATDPGPLPPGMAYEFEVTAEPGQRLHIVSMFVPSNDWIFSFPAEGIALFDGTTGITGDQAGEMNTYDLGTEVDQAVGFGLDQVQNQAAADTGAADADTNVRLVTGQPSVDEILEVTVTPL